MTAEEFRQLALGFSGATEGSHMGHPDFRAHGRVFATLGYPDDESGMVKLPPEDQKRVIGLHPQVFTPAKGAWGLHGSTIVQLSAAKIEMMQQALDLAWQASATVSAKNVPAKVGMRKAAKQAAKRAKKGVTKSHE